MTLHLTRGDQAFPHQQLDVTVIARALEHLPAAHVIDAAVADVGPKRAALLHQTDRTGRARAQLERQLRPERHQRLVGGAESQMQEAKRIQQRLWRVPEAIEQCALRGLGGALTLGVTAHTVAGAEQRRLLGKRNVDAVLIGIAFALKADFCTFDPQASPTAFG